MPGPPPAGRVVHGAVLAQAMIADVAHLERPEIVRQRLAQQRDAQRPGKHFGKQREDGGGPVTRHGQLSSSSSRHRHDDAARRRYRSCGTVSRVKASSTLSPSARGDFDHIAGAEIVDGGDLAQHPAFAVLRFQPDQVGMIEFVFRRSRAARRARRTVRCLSAPRRHCGRATPANAITASPGLAGRKAVISKLAAVLASCSAP